MSVTLVESYNPAWPAWFDRVKAFIEPKLDDISHTIEHVGSTAVPGLTAKPIIDLDVVVDRQAFSAVRGRLEDLGYIHQGDLGVAGREAFDLSDPGTRAELPAHHLYVCERGCQALRDHLAFRDFMRPHPDWIRKLSDLKRSLCEQYHDDREAYMNGKAAMVREITELAMSSSGQADPPVD